MSFRLSNLTRDPSPGRRPPRLRDGRRRRVHRPRRPGLRPHRLVALGLRGAARDDRRRRPRRAVRGHARRPRRPPARPDRLRPHGRGAVPGHRVRGGAVAARRARRPRRGRGVAVHPDVDRRRAEPRRRRGAAPARELDRSPWARTSACSAARCSAACWWPPSAPQAAFVGNAATFLVSAALVASIRVPLQGAARRRGRARRHPGRLPLPGGRPRAADDRHRVVDRAARHRRRAGGRVPAVQGVRRGRRRLRPADGGLGRRLAARRRARAARRCAATRSSRASRSARSSWPSRSARSRSRRCWRSPSR